MLMAGCVTMTVPAHYTPSTSDDLSVLYQLISPHLSVWSVCMQPVSRRQCWLDLVDCCRCSCRRSITSDLARCKCIPWQWLSSKGWGSRQLWVRPSWTSMQLWFGHICWNAQPTISRECPIHYLPRCQSQLHIKKWHNWVFHKIIPFPKLPSLHRVSFWLDKSHQHWFHQPKGQCQLLSWRL